MIKEVIASGKNIIEAQENARAALGANPLDDVKFEVIHSGSKGIFGIIGVKPAQVRAYIEIPDAQEKAPKPRHEKHRPERRENNNNNTNNKNNKKKNDAPKKAKNAEKQDAGKDEPKPAAIPELELKLEKREVKDGEDMSFEFVKTVVSDIGLSAECELYSCEDGTRRIIISGDDASVLIGHHGDTLDALQHLANLASARKNINGERDKSRVTIDIEGYRAKREETLRALARRMAAKALRNKRSVMLEPMSAYERRIIHSEIQGIEGVSTNSIGSDNNRKIVIFLTDKKPTEVFEEDARRQAVEAELEADVEVVEAEVEVVETEVEAVEAETEAVETETEVVETEVEAVEAETEETTEE